MQLQLFGYLKMLNCPICEDTIARGSIDSLLFVKCYHQPYPHPPIPAWPITIWPQVIGDDDEQRDGTFRAFLSQLCVTEACRCFQIACLVIDLLLRAFSQSTVHIHILHAVTLLWFRKGDMKAFSKFLVSLVIVLLKFYCWILQYWDSIQCLVLV